MEKKDIHEMNESEKQKTEDIVQNSFQLLRQTYNEVTERAIKALFLANGGGVVTMLTYFYGLPCPKQKLLLLPLKLFLIGFMAAIIIVSIDYLICLKNILFYKFKINRFTLGEITFEKMQNLYGYLDKISLTFLVLLGLLSVISFITGCLLAVRNFYPC